MDLRTRTGGAEPDVQPTVTLVFGTEEITSLEEEKAFLIEVSSFFEAMLEGGFQERTMDTIVLKDFDGNACKFILESLRQGKDSGVDLSAQVSKIICPEIYQTLMALMIKVDLEKIALYTMNMEQIEAYSKLAFDTGNTKLEKFCLRKALGIFSQFRKTKSFKTMNIEDLTTFLTHKYLDSQCETEIIKAVFGWINQDIKGKESLFDRALSLIKWKKKVKKNQMEFLLLQSKIVKKSESLRKILFSIYLNEFAPQVTGNLKQVILSSTVSPEGPESQMANEVLSSEVKRELRPIALIIQKDFKFCDTPYSAAFLYDCETMTIKDYIYECREDISFNQEYDLYDFQWYMFGKIWKAEGSNPQPNLIKKRKMSNLDQWTTVGGFGIGYRKMKNADRAAAEENLPANSTYGQGMPPLTDGSGSSRDYGPRPSRQGMKYHAERNAGPAELHQDFMVDVRRSAQNFYIFSNSCEVFDSKRKKLKVLWSKGKNYISEVRFPFIYSAHRENQDTLEFVLYNLKTNQTTKLKSKHHLEQQRQIAREMRRPYQRGGQNAPRVQVPKILISNELTFITPKLGNVYVISEKYQTSINDPRRISHDQYELPETPIILQHPIVAQFYHYRRIYLVQKESKQPADNYLLSKLVGTGRNVRAKVIKEMGDLDKQIKDLLTTHFHETGGKILEISKSIKFKPVNSVWAV